MVIQRPTRRKIILTYYPSLAVSLDLVNIYTKKKIFSPEIFFIYRQYPEQIDIQSMIKIEQNCCLKYKLTSTVGPPKTWKSDLIVGILVSDYCKINTLLL